MKLTRAQLEQQVSYHENAHHLYMCALQYVMRGQVAFVCVSNDDQGGRYEYRACGEDRADGGFVLVTFKTKGQSSDTRVSYIDSEYWHAKETAHTTKDNARHYSALSKVLAHRGRYLESTEGKQQQMERQILEAKCEGPSWGSEPIEY